MIDFTGLPKKNKSYAGANGSKISVVYEGEQYMLKFPPHPSKNEKMSYSNSCISEYLGCRIFESVGIQRTCTQAPFIRRLDKRQKLQESNHI